MLEFFVLPNNEDHGTLETILLKCGEKVYPELIAGARAWIDPLDPEDHTIFVTSKERQYLAKPTGKLKAVVAAVARSLSRIDQRPLLHRRQPICPDPSGSNGSG